MAFIIPSLRATSMRLPRSVLPRLSGMGRYYSQSTVSESHSPGRLPIAFTVEAAAKTTENSEEMVQILRDVCGRLNSFTQGSPEHDSALVVASPGFAKLICDDSFLSGLTSVLSSSASQDKEFSLLAAVADRIPAIDSEKRFDEGLAVLRGVREDVMPSLWQPLPPQQKEDADTVAALEFHDASGTSLTLPLTQTLFQNSKQSTLIASRYDISGASPRLVERIETYTQHIAIPSVPNVETVLPLTALTQPRPVTLSFGNIVRGIDVDGEGLPASTELEAAVERIWKIREQQDPTPFPIWAYIVPSSLENSEVQTPVPEIGRFGDPSAELEHIQDEVLRNTGYFEETMRKGGRFYQLLSGGGGWGKKKGLLSLDPQTSHFSLSEEEEMASFFQGGSSSGFAPVGSTIQFFAPWPAYPSPDQLPFVFGVSGFGDKEAELDESNVRVVENRFGALSDKAVYLHSKDPENALLGPVEPPMKLGVPGSRVIFGREKASRSSGRSSFLDAVVGGIALSLF